MTKGFRIALGTAAVAAGLTFAGAAPAAAQVRISGSFPLPHGRISIGIGAPAFPIGSYVPYGYEVYSRQDYGYGFEYESRWIPVRRNGSRWIVCDPPVLTQGVYPDYYGGYGDARYYSNDYRYNDYRYARPSYSYARPSYSYQRRQVDSRFERRDRDDRRDRGDRRDGRDRDRDHDRQWRH